MEGFIYIGIVHSIFTAVFLSSKRDKTLNDKVLAVWMIFMALPLLSGGAGRLLQGIPIPMLHADLIYPLTYGPFLWLYVGTLTGDISRLKLAHLVHFLPFAAMSVFQILSGWSPGRPNPEVEAFGLGVRTTGAINLMLLLVYTTAVVWRLRLHGREVVQHFSELSRNVTLTWIYWVTAGVFWVFFLLFLGSALSLPVLIDIHLGTLVAFILLLSFFGLKQTQVFERQVLTEPVPLGEERVDGAKQSVEHPAAFVPERANPRAPLDTVQDAPNARYSRSGLSEERAEVISRRLKTFMRQEQPYLDAELTIEKLAKRLAVPRHHLTQVISERHGKNFYLFVNEYRIEAVKQILKDPDHRDRTLLEIAYESGFNSKSTFNTAFKRLSGMTPSQYRQQTS